MFLKFIIDHRHFRKKLKSPIPKSATCKNENFLPTSKSWFQCNFFNSPIRHSFTKKKKLSIFMFCGNSGLQKKISHLAHFGMKIWTKHILAHIWVLRNRLNFDSLVALWKRLKNCFCFKTGIILVDVQTAFWKIFIICNIQQSMRDH